MELQPQGLTAEEHRRMPDPITVALASGDTLWFQRFRGLVVEEAKRSEASFATSTSVSSGRGGVLVDTVARTSHERTHAIWLRSKDNMEREVEIPSHNFSTRVGHDVSVAWGARTGVDRGYYVVAVNHTTGNSWHRTVNDAPKDEIEALGALDMPHFWSEVVLVSLGLIFASGIIVGAVSNIKDAILLSFVMACGPAEVVALVWVFTRTARKGIAKGKVVDSCINALANSMREDAGHRSNQEISAQLSASAAS